MVEQIEDVVEALLELLESHSEGALRSLLKDYHPADLAAAMSLLSNEEASHIFRNLDAEESAEVLAEADEELLSRLTSEIPEQQLAQLLEEVEPDDAADILGGMEDEERKTRVLSLVSDVVKTEVEALLTHDEESAGGIMTSDVLAFPETWTVAETIRFLRQAPPEIPFSNAFTLNQIGRLQGVFPIQKLVWSNPNSKLGEIADPKVVRVTPETDQEEVARLFTRYDLVSLPVVDEQERLTGRITVDDILDVVEEETSEDMFKLAGSSDDELVTRSARTVLRFRLPWMLVALAGGIGCAFILGVFELELSQFTYLAFYLPVVMSMGGNIGNQSSTLIVRGLATGQVDRGNLLKTIGKEARVGVLMGVVCGGLMGLVSTLFALSKGDPIYVGLIIALSMVGSMTVAALFASLVPLTFMKLGIDPAVASGPFITMSNDAMALVIYLSVTRSLDTLLLA